MHKIFVTCTIFASLLVAQPAVAAGPYVSLSDIQAVNQSIDSHGGMYCPMQWQNATVETEGYADYLAWKNGLRLVTSEPIGAYDRYSLVLKGRSVSMVLPYDKAWSLQGKQVRPYLLTGDRTAEVGPLDFIHVSGQDDSCAFARRYSVSLQKGTVKTIDAELKREQAKLRADGVTTDTSAHVPTVMMGTSMALVPSVMENSGGYTLQYDRVSVNLTGGWVLTIQSKGGYASTVDTTMLRMAASAR